MLLLLFIKPYSANKAKPFFTDFVFSLDIIYVYFKASYAVCGDTGMSFAAMFVTFLCISYFVWQICINLTSDAVLLSGEKII